MVGFNFQIAFSQPAFPPGIDAIMELLRDKQRAAAQPDPEVEAASLVALKKVAAVDLERALVSQAVGDDLAQARRLESRQPPHMRALAFRRCRRHFAQRMRASQNGNIREAPMENRRVANTGSGESLMRSQVVRGT